VLREILSLPLILVTGTRQLPLALGKDIGGEPVVAKNLADAAPVIAGTTGIGKSVAMQYDDLVAACIKLTPRCRMIMIDPRCWSCRSRTAFASAFTL